MEKHEKIKRAYYLVNALKEIPRDMDKVKKLNVVDGYNLSQLEEYCQALDREDFCEAKGLLEDFLIRRLNKKLRETKKELDKINIE